VTQNHLRSKVIRLAHAKPELRPHLLPLVRKQAMEFPTEEARKKYLEAHPDADASKHTVKGEGDGEGKTEGEGKKSPGGFKAKFTAFMAKAKGATKSVVDSLKEAPEKIQKFVADPVARKEATQKTADFVKKSPEKLANRLYDAARHELKEIKHAGTALKKVLKKPREKWDKKDKKALYAAGVYVAHGALAAAGGGPLIAAGALGKSFVAHVGFKAIKHIVDEGFLHYEAGETGLHGIHAIKHLVEHLFAADGDDDDKFEKALIQYLTVSVGAVLEKGITDEEMLKILAEEEFDPESLTDEPKVKS